MKISGEYVPSSVDFVRTQVKEYESSGGLRANVVAGTDYPIVILTYRGAKSGFLRKTALMRVEHDGCYALIASSAGSDAHPAWYHSIVTESLITVQDGPAPAYFRARELKGLEREDWWRRAVAVYPTYADYKVRTDRQIPVMLAEPA